MRRVLLLTLLSFFFFEARAQSPLAVAHAHNDYVHSRPFFEAYELQFGSIECDLWLADGKLLVGHDLKDLRPERTFESLYLHPLLKQIQANRGTPYRNGQPLQLLIDLKSEWTQTLPLLESVLKPHRAALAPAVRIVISGNMPPPDQYAQFDPLLTFDGRRKTRYSAESGKRVILVSEPFYALAGAWDGKKELAEPARQRVKAFADSLHAAGKKLRFWATPDHPLAYETLLKLGVDYVGTDDLNGLATFLRNRPAKPGSGQLNPSLERWLISTPAGDRYTEVKPQGETVLPNGRIVKPLGRTWRIAPHPYGLTLSADGKTAITANSGTNPFSISILDNVLSETPGIHQIPDQPKTDDDLLGAVFMGLAVSPDNKLVYVAGVPPTSCLSSTWPHGKRSAKSGATNPLTGPISRTGTSATWSSHAMGVPSTVWIRSDFGCWSSIRRNGRSSPTFRRVGTLSA